MNEPGPATPPLADAHAHWTIYLPSVAVALVWAGVYAYAALHEPALPGLRALALVVVVLGTPVLFAAAALRARVLSVEVRGAATESGEALLVARTGLARPRDVGIGADEIASLHVRRSLPQRLFGGGALDIRTLSGETLWITDLDRPEAIVAALRRPPNSELGHLGHLK